MKKIISILLIFVFFVSCYDFKNDKDTSEKFIGKYYEEIEKKNFNQVLNYYDDIFFSVTKKDEWLNTLIMINQKLGILKTYKQISWNIKTGVINSDTYVMLTYEVVYSKYNAIERITLCKSYKNKSLKIIGHDIKSNGF